MKRVLVVDDEFLVAELIVYALEERGYHVLQAFNGKSALAQMNKSPALVITDFMMPLMNGLEFALSVRDDRNWNDVPIILISAAQAAISEENRRIFAAVFEKPFDVQAVLGKVEELIGPPEPDRGGTLF
ncbi:response regulator [Chelativorans sp. Marseille-P2723]|uniref:response regulator n=1 Tax=Chelativorans sp. Marseille-P2723 TaxID=2709133 RepID=UPI0015715C00|nr:response regulator [Chelativorans sp. Marseille-P2723]